MFTLQTRKEISLEAEGGVWKSFILCFIKDFLFLGSCSKDLEESECYKEKNVTCQLIYEHGLKASRLWRDLKQAFHGENEHISTTKLEGEC